MPAAVSDAVIVCGPAVMRAAENVPWPALKAASGGSTTPVDVSLAVKWTVPPYDVTVFPCASIAVTVKLNALPGVTVAGALSFRACAVGGGGAPAGRSATASAAQGVA